MYDRNDPTADVVFRATASNEDAMAKAISVRDENNAAVNAGKQPQDFFYEVDEQTLLSGNFGKPIRYYVVVRRDRPGMDASERTDLTVAQDMAREFGGRVPHSISELRECLGTAFA